MDTIPKRTSSPCKDCKDRTITPNCHGTCERYLEYTSYMEFIKNKRLEHKRKLGINEYYG